MSNKITTNFLHENPPEENLLELINLYTEIQPLIENDNSTPINIIQEVTLRPETPHKYSPNETLSSQKPSIRNKSFRKIIKYGL